MRPAPLRLPQGFAAAPPMLAMGGELKAAFCLLRDGQAILSHHMGDLANAQTFADYARSIDAYQQLFEHAPAIIAIDRHPDYLSAKLGRDLAASNIRRPSPRCSTTTPTSPPAWQRTASHWTRTGDRRGAGRAWLRPGRHAVGRRVPAGRLSRVRTAGDLQTGRDAGGAQAIREPWRNTYAHLMAGMGWARFATDYAETPLHRFLQAKPRAVLDGMIARGVNSPLASSCGRLVRCGSGGGRHLSRTRRLRRPGGRGVRGTGGCRNARERG